MRTPIRNNSTAHQRLLCRTLLSKAELPTHVVTVLHRDLFRRLGIEWRDGVDMDPTLESLTDSQIRSLIDALRKRIGEDEES